MPESFPIPSELQPGFALFVSAAVFLGGATFVTLCLLSFAAKRRETHGSLDLKNWIIELYQLFLRTISDFEEKSATYTRSHSNTIDLQSIGIVVLACFSLASVEYYGGSANYYRLTNVLRPLFPKFSDDISNFIFNSPEYGNLFRLGYWSFFIFLLYFLLPAAFSAIVLRKSPKSFGLELHGLIEHAWIYVSLFLFVFPFVVAVSLTPSFRGTYPFYPNAGRSLFDFFGWELVYAMQFFSLEFFFRGFLIHGLKKRFGFYAILLSVVPYCMIHFGKPFPETLGAVIAGLALGTLSLFSRSIWLGVLIHISVAISMDFLSLAGQGRF